ncbi:MurR/RpiR family transcriptional regulator [uncultured Roseibium sp.]|uniref:MurR/RpiR family transcriptional regulator n=1 Tax=uncultured Roseibium sp. TaxID=1936171 RepID=UPI00262453BD|nr:MurR/RpiR family transcriptional regulator [uncultured Roseibium sp.]
MGTRLALRIQERYEELTPSEQKLAQFLLDRPDEILASSATELARFTGVSKATAARLFRNLGYNDFNDVRLQAREERNRTGPVQQIPMPQASVDETVTVPTHLQVESANLTRTFEELRPDVLNAAAEQIAGAGRVWVAGLGIENGIARYLRILLTRVRPAVHMISENAATWPEELASTGPNDALIIIAVRPWTKQISTVLTFARTTRLKTIVITDPTNTGKARRKEATVLNCHVSTPWSELTQTSVLSMAQLLAATVANRIGGRAKARRDLIADLAEEIESGDI